MSKYFFGKATQATDRRPTQKIRRLIPRTILPLLCIVLAISTVFFWHQAQTQKGKNPTQVVTSKARKEKADQITAAIQKTLVIKSSASPTIAEIKNANKLKASSKFYQDATDGDYLVLYPDQSIIFRLSEKKIINVAPILQDPQKHSQ